MPLTTGPQPNELIFLGTGTSGAIPVVACLTSPKQNCKTCLSSNPKNTRLNTGAVFRIPRPGAPPKPDGSPEYYNLLVDCGKTFYTGALRWFPKRGIRQIDGLLLTHAHADAMFGLDDLRAWTLPSTATNEAEIQKHVDVYCSKYTMDQVAVTFPYLVDKRAATGGGDIPKFSWHVFDDSDGDGDGSFTIPSCGDVRVTPLKVEHGRFMSSGEPFICLGFRVGDFSYISDCSSIPERTAALMKGSKVVVMDGLKYGEHPSHFSIQQGREWVRDNLGSGPGSASSKLTGGNDQVNGYDGSQGPFKTWLVGFSHNIEHEETTAECAEWGRSETGGKGMKVAPAWDGLRIGTDGQAIADD